MKAITKVAVGACLLFCSLVSADWVQTFREAVVAQESGQLEEADRLYTLAIEELAALGEDANPLRNERAVLRIDEGEEAAALEDCNAILASLNDQEGPSQIQKQALCQRMYCAKALGDTDLFLSDCAQVEKWGYPFPKPEVRFVGDTMIASSPLLVGDRQKIHAMASRMLQMAKLCDSEDAITVAPNGTLVVRLLPWTCPAPNNEANDAFFTEALLKEDDVEEEEEELHMAKNINPPVIAHPGAPQIVSTPRTEASQEARQNQAIRLCKRKVNMTFGVGTLLAGRLRSLPGGAMLCITLEGLREKAIECCESGDFYGNCVKPIFDFLATLEMADPAWN